MTSKKVKKLKSNLRTRDNPTLLSLLRMGAKITLPDGRYLEGEPATGYVKIGRGEQWLGRYILDRKGLRLALADRDWRQAPMEQLGLGV